MSRDRDTNVFESSLGDVTVQWAWNRWVTVSTAYGRPTRGQIGSRWKLVELLVEAGLPNDEAVRAARETWRARPSAASRSGRPNPGDHRGNKGRGPR